MTLTLHINIIVLLFIRINTFPKQVYDTIRKFAVVSFIWFMNCVDWKSHLSSNYTTQIQQERVENKASKSSEYFLNIPMLHRSVNFVEETEKQCGTWTHLLTKLSSQDIFILPPIVHSLYCNQSFHLCIVLAAKFLIFQCRISPSM